MTTFLEDESSADASEPREFYDIVLPTVTYRHASGTRDIVAFGNVYTAIPIARSALEVNRVGDSKDLVLKLPINHELAKRWVQYNNPPKTVTVTVWRKEIRSAVIEKFWIGNITSMGIEGGRGSESERVATFRVPFRAGELRRKYLPTQTASKQCNHMLYDRMCQISRSGSSPSGLPFKSTTTVIYVNGRTVRVDLPAITVSDPFRAAWAKNGELKHVATGESQSVFGQTDLNPGISSVADLDMQGPIVGLQVGDTVEVYAGCDWLSATCSGKFNNRQHLLSFHMKADIDAFAPTGDGLKGL